MPDKSWDQYRELFLHEMAEAKEFRTEQRQAMAKIQQDVASLRTSSSMWGALSGLMSGIVTAVFGMFYYMRSR